MALKRESNSEWLVLVEPSTKQANSRGRSYVDRGWGGLLGGRPHFRGLTSLFLLTGPALQGQGEGLGGGHQSYQKAGVYQNSPQEA